VEVKRESMHRTAMLFLLFDYKNCPEAKLTPQNKKHQNTGQDIMHNADFDKLFFFSYFFEIFFILKNIFLISIYKKKYEKIKQKIPNSCEMLFEPRA
jgi:hypothetical protein